ncbi:hypothetical protein LOTGIDRAFT_228561 [Lottia gigantea]|uniref:AMOP domain-containing protein n=1 Tax=Lottia gigantea TaxID=225164 RepID=V4AJN6_LOTGI|nr:hypothetical protein LOTGIDRAFT_228561 [Lottia gigantea]ESO93786.1 hypothetical protein LOTGIDRAFT_228561 [Lottia gigantea]
MTPDILPEGDIRVNEGEAFTLICISQLYRPVLFSKAGVAVPPSRIYNDSTIELTVAYSKITHSGRYVCLGKRIDKPDISLDGKYVIVTESESVLLPFGRDEEDTLIKDSTSVTQLNLSQPIYYYGLPYSTLYISKDGLVAFHPKVAYLQQFWRENPSEHNHPFIAPYYYSGEATIPAQKAKPGEIYYRVIYDDGSIEERAHFLHSLEQYIMNNVVGVRQFEAKTALVVTWKDVTDSPSAIDGCMDDDGVPACTDTDTFQLVLVADRSQTFAIFNYLKMDLLDHHFYQAGMNGGLGNGWTDVFCGDRCGRMDLNMLPSLYGSDMEGRFIYKVSDDVIVRGGCLPLQAKSGLEFYPQYANMYGGEIIDISGYCIRPGQSVMCKFGEAEETSAVSFVNSTKLRCQVPRMTEHGMVDLIVSADSGDLIGQFHIGLFARSEHHIRISMGDPTMLWNETNPEKLSFSWDVHPLGDGNVPVEISLLGYRESYDGINWKVIDDLGKGTVENGDHQLIFNVADHQCDGDDCWKYEIGLLEVGISPNSWTLTNTHGSYSFGPIPLGWFVRDFMMNQHGAGYSEIQCREWYEKDKKNMDWLEELLSCPCNLNQAVMDFGRFQPDMGCNMYTGSACHYHIGAVHCVRSVNPTASGAGNQCCYGNDGNLMYSADSYNGATPDRCHDWGAPPFNKPDYVPSLSHWKHDVISFYHCCLWVNYANCDLYMEQRATRDCRGYTPPKTAFVYGDPHIVTFDEQEYNLPGRGEYWLMKDEGLSIQARFDKVTSLNATGLVAVVVQAPGDSRIEARITSMDTGKQLNIVVDGKVRNFGSIMRGGHKMVTPSWQDFNGVSVTRNPSYKRQDNHGNFTILLQSGVGVQVAAVGNLIYLSVIVPDSFKGRGNGLLGSWDDDVDNDFTTPDGTMVDSDSTREDIYSVFGLQWVVTTDVSLFQYPEGFELNFIPLFDDPPLADGLNFFQVKRTCLEDPRCIHDYSLTGSIQIGLATLRTVGVIESARESQKKVLSCGLLDVPGGLKSNLNYTLGSAITVMSCNTGELTGDTNYRCVQTTDDEASWEPEVSASCHGEGVDEASVGMIVGIVLSILAVLGIVTAVIIILYRRRSSSTPDEESIGPEREVMMKPIPKTRKSTTDADTERGPARPRASSKESI